MVGGYSQGKGGQFPRGPPPPLNETLITLFLWSQLACMLKVILYYYKQGARFAPPPPAPKSAILHLIPACTYIQKLFAVQVHLLRADLARENGYPAQKCRVLIM